MPKHAKTPSILSQRNVFALKACDTQRHKGLSCPLLSCPLGTCISANGFGFPTFVVHDHGLPLDQGISLFFDWIFLT